MMRKSLKSLLNDNNKDLEIFTKRPEQLSVKEFVELTNLIG
jgi:16S rRNA A1518/A1519 N6-dimethyltransferase RsmA/KsgA/DIM1 with predicted DNA glycosylase/AP lyase activity